MKTLAQTFLSPEEQEKITRCVQEMERKTSGEIVPMVVSASHIYPLASVTGAVFLALPLALLATRLIGSTLWIGPDNMWLFIGCFSLLSTAGYHLVKRSLPLKRLFLASHRADEEVREAAATAFFTERLYRTKAKNGILLYISLLERRAWILADEGINARIPQDQWQDIVNRVTEGVRNKRQCDAICEAIERIGEMLQAHFPIAADDKDELHNLIIR